MGHYVLDFSDSGNGNSDSGVGGKLAGLNDLVKIIGFFDQKKLIIVKHGFLAADKIAELIRERKLNEDKDQILVFAENQASAELAGKSRKLFSILTRKPAVSKIFEPLAGRQLENWVAKEIRGLRCGAEGAAVKKLIGNVGNDSWLLHNELEKLASYVNQSTGGSKTILPEHVELLVTPNLDLNIFNLLDALGRRDKAKTILLLARQLESGTDPFHLFSMFVYQFRGLLRVKSAGHHPPSGLHPYAAKKLAEQARLFGLEELKQRFAALAVGDQQIKSGQINSVDWLYQFALQ